MNEDVKKKIVFFTGAGVSAESGLPTFRGKEGLWEQLDVEKVATKKAWYSGRLHDCNDRRQAVLDFINGMRRTILEHKPNDAHKLIAGFEPDYDVTIITQNGDDYHEQAGSTRVIHLHGHALYNASTLHPAECWAIDRNSPDIKIGDKAADGSQVRPYAVLFGEDIEMPIWKEARLAMQEADICVVIGCSLLVYPAVDLLSGLNNEASLYIVNLEEVKLPNDKNVIHAFRAAYYGLASEGMVWLKNQIKTIV